MAAGILPSNFLAFACILLHSAIYSAVATVDIVITGGFEVRPVQRHLYLDGAEGL